MSWQTKLAIFWQTCNGLENDPSRYNCYLLAKLRVLQDVCQDLDGLADVGAQTLGVKNCLLSENVSKQPLSIFKQNFVLKTSKLTTLNVGWLFIRVGRERTTSSQTVWAGSAKANGIEPISCLGRVFNFRLGNSVMYAIAWHIQKHVLA